MPFIRFTHSRRYLLLSNGTLDRRNTSEICIECSQPRRLHTFPGDCPPEERRTVWRYESESGTHDLPTFPHHEITWNEPNYTNDTPEMTDTEQLDDYVNILRNKRKKRIRR